MPFVVSNKLDRCCGYNDYGSTSTSTLLCAAVCVQSPNKIDFTPTVLKVLPELTISLLSLFVRTFNCKISAPWLLSFSLSLYYVYCVLYSNVFGVMNAS